MWRVHIALQGAVKVFRCRTRVIQPMRNRLIRCDASQGGCTVEDCTSGIVFKGSYSWSHASESVDTYHNGKHPFATFALMLVIFFLCKDTTKKSFINWPEMAVSD